MFYKSIIILFHSVCAINVFHPMCQFYTLGRTYVWISHALYLQSAKKLFFIVEMPPWRRAVRRPTKGVSYLKKITTNRNIFHSGKRRWVCQLEFLFVIFRFREWGCQHCWYCWLRLVLLNVLCFTNCEYFRHWIMFKYCSCTALHA